ncbi:MAG: DUF3164 family protein [Pseudomonadota bacterium]|nr:DUF3164 family protein [Pseudomonadota bacterium]
MSTIPEGYRKNGKGDLVSIANIKPKDVIRDEFVLEALIKAEEAQAYLQKFKSEMMTQVDDFIELLSQEHDVQMGGKKGNITLRSYDHSAKVVVQNHERIELGPELNVAKELIDQCLDEWTHDGNANIRAIVNKVFATDKKGTLNPQRILSLRQLEITDDSGRWAKAMNIIAESVDVVDSSRFIRFYKKDEHGNEQAVSLDIAKL